MEIHGNKKSELPKSIKRRPRCCFPSKVGRKRGLRVYRHEPDTLLTVHIWYKDLAKIYGPATDARGRFVYGAHDSFYVSKEDLERWTRSEE